MNINLNHNYLAFDRQINSSKAWLKAKVFDACGYSSGVLLDRLMQRLVEISLFPYSLAVSILWKTTSIYSPTPGTQINCCRASMEIGSGKITVTTKQLLANQLDFLVRWAFCLLAILFVKKTSKNNLPAVLVFGVGEEALFADNNDERFVNYCRLGPVEPLRKGNRFFVQSPLKNASSDPFKFVYCRRPLISLLCETEMGFFGRLRLLIDHIILFFAYQHAVFRLPQLALLGGEIAYSRVSFELDRLGLIDSVVLTCSSSTSQPLWVRALRRAKVHMIWYAQNHRPIAYAADNLVSDVPSLRWIRVDTHWVWTHAFAEYLRTRCRDQEAIKVVGPIIWYMPEVTQRAKSSIEIVVFDLSPYHDDIALTYGEISNYNHPDNLFSFVQDITSLKSIIENVFHLPVACRLKTKRGYQATYDRAYFEYLEKLDSLGSISLEHHSTNIYSLISRSHLVIAYPFTSPAYAAEFLGVPSIYYDPTNSISRQDFSDSKLVHFANCPEDLLNVAISALSKVFRNGGLFQAPGQTVED